MIWAAVSWYCAGPIIALNGRITASDYVDSLSNQVYPVVQMLLPNNDAIFQDDGRFAHNTARIVQSWIEKHEDALQISSLSSTIARLEYRWTTVVGCREYGEKQIISSISEATTRCSSWRVVQCSTSDSSELTWVYSKKDADRITSKQWSNSLLIKKCVSFTTVSIFFVHPMSIIHVLLCAQYVRYVHNCTEYSYTQFGSLNDFS